VLTIIADAEAAGGGGVSLCRKQQEKAGESPVGSIFLWDPPVEKDDFCHTTGSSGQPSGKLEKEKVVALFFEWFPYVCPEPVLAK
jgi:hypothetical protein